MKNISFCENLGGVGLGVRVDVDEELKFKKIFGGGSG